MFGSQCQFGFPQPGKYVCQVCFLSQVVRLLIEKASSSHRLGMQFKLFSLSSGLSKFLELLNHHHVSAIMHDKVGELSASKVCVHLRTSQSIRTWCGGREILLLDEVSISPCRSNDFPPLQRSFGGKPQANSRYFGTEAAS